MQLGHMSSRAYLTSPVYLSTVSYFTIRKPIVKIMAWRQTCHRIIKRLSERAPAGCQRITRQEVWNVGFYQESIENNGRKPHITASHDRNSIGCTGFAGEAIRGGTPKKLAIEFYLAPDIYYSYLLYKYTTKTCLLPTFICSYSYFLLLFFIAIYVLLSDLFLMSSWAEPLQWAVMAVSTTSELFGISKLISNT